MVPNVHAEIAYEILGVPRTATAQDVRQAFRKLALKHHPDAVPTDQKQEASVLFARINQAYEVLRDPDRRRRYDELLGRGITPDLNREVGDVGVGRLGDVLGQIEALDVEDRRRSARWRLTNQFRDMLFSSLINDGQFKEKVIDLVPAGFLAVMKTSGYEWPPSRSDLDAWAKMGYDLDPPKAQQCTANWVVVTDLRIIVLHSFDHKFYPISRGWGSRTFEVLTGGAKQTEMKYFRMRSFPYLSLKRLEVSERGRASKSYLLHLADEDHTAFDVPIKKPRLAQLLLVASAYGVPLRVNSEASARSEVIQALWWGLAPGLLWLAVLLVAYVYGWLTASGKPADAHLAPLESTYSFLLNWGITPAVAYLIPAQLTFGLWRCYCAWNVAVPGQVFGDLPTDLARDPPGHAEEPAAAPRPEPPPAPPVEPPALPEAPPADPGVAVEVGIPDAVREAFGAPPSAESAQVICPACGVAAFLDSATPTAFCGTCGHRFDGGA
jgi:hypothetical protein